MTLYTMRILDQSWHFSVFTDNYLTIMKVSLDLSPIHTAWLRIIQAYVHISIYLNSIITFFIYYRYITPTHAANNINHSFYLVVIRWNGTWKIFKSLFVTQFRAGREKWDLKKEKKILKFIKTKWPQTNFFFYQTNKNHWFWVIMIFFLSKLYIA